MIGVWFYQIAIMDQYQHRTKKRFGQHFLHDPHVINGLLRAINPKPEQQLIEIGPGGGALTFPLLKEIDHLEVVEIDRDVIAWLSSQGELKDKLTVHAQDALTLKLAELKKSENKLRIVGNLPYNISTPLIFNLLDQAEHVQDMHFMLQKEVVDRMVAVPSTKDYGRLAVMVQYFCHTEFLFKVGPGAFNPPPKVDSAIVRLEPRLNIENPANSTETLSKVVAQAFAQRRKTLRNTLKKVFSSEQIESVGIDPSQRAETLSVDDFVRLSNLL